ncbi:MAG: hypothetical protein SH809_17560, partial [Rhodothermales bacterium]|nr:hypothetical protein [Rhodothermales bacterium]
MIRFLLLFLLLAGCDFPGEDDASALTYTPVFDASTFEADVTHPFFTLVGNVFRQYQGQTPEGLKTIQTVVTGTRRTVAGVSTTVVRDRVFVDGLQVGLVFRWYAQDAAGNVWHLGT